MFQSKKRRNENSTKCLKKNKFSYAFQLPTLCNINPRSIYNNTEELSYFIEQNDIDVCFISESWERELLTLDKVLKLDSHCIISNVHQRKGKGRH